MIDWLVGRLSDWWIVIKLVIGRYFCCFLSIVTFVSMMCSTFLFVFWAFRRSQMHRRKKRTIDINKHQHKKTQKHAKKKNRQKITNRFSWCHHNTSRTSYLRSSIIGWYYHYNPQRTPLLQKEEFGIQSIPSKTSSITVIHIFNNINNMILWNLTHL